MEREQGIAEPVMPKQVVSEGVMPAWVLRRSLVALAVWLTLTIGYGLVLARLDATARRFIDPTGGTVGWMIIVAALVATSFPFAERRLRRMLERLLCHAADDYQAELRRSSARVISLPSVTAVWQHALARLLEWLSVTRAAITAGDSAAPRLDRHGQAPPIDPVAVAGGPARDVDIVESISDAFIALNRQLRCTYLNHAAASLLGRPRHEVLGKQPWGGCSLASDTRCQTAARRVLEEHVAVQVETYQPESNRWLEITMFPIVDGLAIYLSDVTKRKQAEEALHTSEERYRAIVESSDDTIHIKDAEGRYVMVNPAMLRNWHLRPEDVIGRTPYDLYPPEVARKVAEADWHVLKTGETVTTEEEHYQSQGRRYAHVIKVPLRDAAGAVVGVATISRDITELKVMEEALRKERDFTAAVLDTAPSLIVVLDSRGRIVRFNRTCEKVNGYPFEEVVGRPVWEVLGVPEEEEAIRTLVERLARGEVSSGELESHWLEKDGGYGVTAWAYTTLCNTAGRVDYIVGTGKDVTEDRWREEHLTFMATHDPLTGLPNRRSFEDTIKGVLARGGSEPFGVILFIDVDNFKIVNDTMGHSAGDRVLTLVAQLLKDQLGTEDVIARVGGDEFAVILNGATVDEAQDVAERLRRVIDEYPFAVDDQSFKLGLSVGLVPMEVQRDPNLLMSQADATMYKAKQQGRNRIVLYRPEQDDVVWFAEANHWAARIQIALHEGRLVLHYQPVVRLSTAEVEYYEALLRLIDEEGSIVLPARFIPAAERFGLMPQLTRWVVQEVIKTLTAHPHIRVFVNLSAHCIADDTLLTFIETTVRESAVDPRRIGFEVAETVMINDLKAARRWIERLQAIGCRFALDDFGVGFNSFAYLQNLPVNELKIDGSLVRAIDTDPTQRVMVQTVQMLARTMGIDVVAEFVETESIARVLQAIGIAYGQGFHLGRPGPEFSGKITGTMSILIDATR